MDREKLQSLRRRRGLTQRELSELANVAITVIRDIEQGEKSSIRLETLRKLAKALGVRTTVLRVGNDTDHADPETVDLWGPTRRALAAQPDDRDEPATNEGVRDAYEALRPMLDAHQYAEISTVLPTLLRDAETLSDREGRAIRSQLLSMTGWLLCQNRQFETAAAALDRAIDSAVDRGTAGPAVNALVWTYLRQGRLDDARALAIRWADDIEPRFSRATVGQLAFWGRLWMYIANASVRDNLPGETENALSLARAAADRIGHEITYDPNPLRTFGPITVAHTTAECAAIAERPDATLSIAESVPTAVLAPTAASRLRHRLDVASAHAQLRQYGEAMAELEGLRTTAPEWLPQQRYARDILGTIISKRRTLTPEMREMADAIKVEY